MGGRATGERTKGPCSANIRFTDESDREYLEAALTDYDHTRGIDCEIRVIAWPTESLPVGTLEISGCDLTPLHPEDFLRDRRPFRTRIASRGPYFSGERVRIEIRGKSLKGPSQSTETTFAFLPAIDPPPPPITTMDDASNDILEDYKAAARSVECVEVSEERLTLNYSNKSVSYAFSDLAKASIITTDEGPFLDDVFWLLMFKIIIMIPQGIPGEDRLLARMQELPGFDNDAMIQAMSSSENNAFHVYEKE